MSACLVPQIDRMELQTNRRWPSMELAIPYEPESHRGSQPHEQGDSVRSKLSPGQNRSQQQRFNRLCRAVRICFAHRGAGSRNDLLRLLGLARLWPHFNVRRNVFGLLYVVGGEYRLDQGRQVPHRRKSPKRIERAACPTIPQSTAAERWHSDRKTHGLAKVFADGASRHPGRRGGDGMDAAAQ